MTHRIDSVTMPIKVSMLPYLDEISPESKVTGACNTIVKVPTATGYKLVGQNTDSTFNTILSTPPDLTGAI
jgi:shikimate 5-dehydrogenase